MSASPTPTTAHLAAPKRSRLAVVRRMIVADFKGSAIASAVMFVLLMAQPTAALAAGKAASDTHAYIQLALYLGGLSLLPFAVMTLTSFLRIVVVLSFLRSGLGAQNVPPNIVVIALALFLSLFVMGPTIDTINHDAVTPYQNGKMSFDTAVGNAGGALKTFMTKQIGGSGGRKEIKTFYGLAHQQAEKAGRGLCAASDTAMPKGCLANEAQYEKFHAQALPLRVVIPAFMISELKKAFVMGFAVLLPFLVIDMVISNILLSLGMMMLPPPVISLPFKILLFVIAGGWTMVVEFLVAGFNY
ncbi:MAG: EscR/YscR/HrcR family type III secretion system export apparatus protein [Thermoleophilia bacterium]|nr:EscR/YscR/HrcR family type III secretion system export apparatus protein [Thermoleophilia bacterium]